MLRALIRAAIPEAIRVRLRPYLRLRPYQMPDISQEQWDQEYRDGRWSYLYNDRELAHYSVIVGYYMHYRPGGSLLDVGCGEAVLQRRLRTFGYARYLGIDKSQEAIARAQSERDARTEFHCADAETFTPQDRYDVIVYNEILYYLKDPMGVVRRLSRALNPGGISIVSMFRGASSSIPVWQSIETTMRIADGVTVTHPSVGSWDIKVIRSEPI